MSNLTPMQLNTAVFLSGIIFATFAASGLFFFKFFKKTRETFFLVFAIACWFLAVERVAFLYCGRDAEAHSWVFLLRLTAFLLLIVAIVRANRARRMR